MNAAKRTSRKFDQNRLAFVIMKDVRRLCRQGMSKADAIATINRAIAAAAEELEGRAA